jgi:hypothetical protein
MYYCFVERNKCRYGTNTVTKTQTFSTYKGLGFESRPRTMCTLPEAVFISGGLWGTHRERAQNSPLCTAVTVHIAVLHKHFLETYVQLATKLVITWPNEQTGLLRRWEQCEVNQTVPTFTDVTADVVENLVQIYWQLPDENLQLQPTIISPLSIQIRLNPFKCPHEFKE